MKQCWLLMFVCVGISAAPRTQDSSASKEAYDAVDITESFFNGTDLTGWHGLPGYWRVQDGAIVGHSGPDGLRFNTFLCSRRPYTNFELTFKVKLTGDLRRANSGVQIRSGLFNLDTCAVLGPQCDMGQIYWGSLYGENFGGMMQAAPADKVQAVLRPGEINDYSIRVVGNHVTTKLNGQVMVERAFPMLPDQGLIAWQLHSGPPMEVVFRDIRLLELRPKPKPR